MIWNFELLDSAKMLPVRLRMPCDEMSLGNPRRIEDDNFALRLVAGGRPRQKSAQGMAGMCDIRQRVGNVGSSDACINKVFGRGDLRGQPRQRK